MNDSVRKAPFHLWVVGILSLLWNAVGAFDYTATKFQLEFYMSQFTPEQLEFFYGFPLWVNAAWAIAIWASLLGSLFLLFRKALSAWLFGIAILGLAVTSVHNFILTDGMAIMGEGAATFSVVIWVIALFLYFYASAMARRRVIN